MNSVINWLPKESDSRKSLRMVWWEPLLLHLIQTITGSKFYLEISKCQQLKFKANHVSSRLWLELKTPQSLSPSMKVFSAQLLWWKNTSPKPSSHFISWAPLKKALSSMTQNHRKQATLPTQSQQLFLSSLTTTALRTIQTLSTIMEILTHVASVTLVS